MRRFFKKSLALMMIATMLLPSSVTAKEIAPTVGNKQTETPPTVTKQLNIPTDVSVTIEEKQEVSTTEVKTTEASTEKDKPANEAEAVKTDATETVDKDVKETELNAFKESNDSEKMTQTLLIKADKESDIPKDGEVLSSYEDTYLVSFPDTETAKAIYEDTKTDASLNIPFGVATGNKTSSSIIEPDVLDNLEEVIKEDDKKDSSFKITEEDYSIALIDTGVPKSEKNVEYISMLDDDGYDEHGHGTSMLENIRKQDKDAKILSIKALDKNGYGDAATIYAAIKYAIERKVDVINLSISGFATEGNKCIEEVIKEAIKQGIIVVGAAGNDNLPASAFIPGGIDEIIVVGACNENNERKTFSNYGITVDYYANASSTSQASAIVAGTISANKGDVKKLDDIFFKTPDLSIFDDDLKKRNMPNTEEDEENFENDSDEGHHDDNDCNDGGADVVYDSKPITDEEFLLKKLYRYVNEAGFRVAAQNASIHKTATPKKDLKNTYEALGTYYAVDPSLIRASNVTVSGEDTNSKWTTKTYAIKYNCADCTETNLKGVDEGLWVLYDLGEGNGTSADVPIAEDVTITIKNCIRSSADLNTYDWVIKITNANFKWGTNWNTAAGVKDNRRDLIAVGIWDNRLPQFTTGANFAGDLTKDYKVDSANQFDFEMSVNGATSGVLLTGFKDLDQWQLFPVGQTGPDGNGGTRVLTTHDPDDRTKGSSTNSFDERIDIINTAQLGSKDIWLTDNTWLDPKDQGSGIRVHSTQYEGEDTISVDPDSNEGTVYFGVAAAAASATQLYWQGCRCQTDIGLKYHDLLNPSTIITYADFQDPDGQYRNNLEVNRDTQYAGTAYSYTYDGTGAGTYHNFTGTWGGTPNNDGTVSTTFSIADQSFQLHVPRVSFRYTFNANKPASATANVENMPSWGGNNYFEKLAENIAGENPGSPRLKGYSFMGWFDTPAATGGTAYKPDEQMISNKTFYARWEPMKYYIRYNANGSTNFNENATNGMQAGEYTQNTTSGATAYQIFTYDTAGEALRANGFTRRGYTYVCWNTTATRTGTDYNPGYVKPANVNWIKGDGTDPMAALDGTHTYPVVDLYAVWKQKLGTETLKIVSEETGNPVSGVSLKLTNTSNNNQISTGTTGANGTVTVSNLHWFPYKWESTAVPAGYKNMIPVNFAINPALTTDESFLTVNNERILYMKHVKLTINSIVDDIIKGENAPNFMYHVTGTDVAGVTHSYDVMVQTSTNTKKGTNIVPVNSGSEEPYMFAGNYTVTQYDVSRYVPRNAQNVKNVTPVGINANANLTNNDDAEVTFPYGIKQYGGFSGVHSLINKLTK